MNTSNEFIIKDLVKLYNKVRVLDIGNMILKPGQFVALMGKNGSGKSTIMRLLAQQELFDSGDIFYSGETLKSTKIELNPIIAFISEELELPFSVSLRYWVGTYRKLYSTFDDSLFEKLIRSFEIDINKSFNSLSRGQKVKVLFCLEAAKRPKVYLLDEVTSVLDQGSRWTLMQFLKKEAEGNCLVVMSTNIAGEMQGFATDLVFLENGKINFQSKSSALADHFVKFRVSKDQEGSLSKNLKARRVGYNSDHTWTFLCSKQSLTSENSVTGMDDLREITISDVQSYFTAGEKEL